MEEDRIAREDLAGIEAGCRRSIEGIGWRFVHLDGAAAAAAALDLGLDHEHVRVRVGGGGKAGPWCLARADHTERHALEEAFRRT